MATHDFVVCVANQGYEVSLELRKLYEILPDPAATKHDQVRIIDESGEDYLYPASLFTRLELSSGLVKQLLHTA